jgi:hypothetical protein
MNARVTFSLLTLIFVMGLALSAAAYAQAPAGTAVQIDTLAIEGTTLTITGKNFGGGVPVVRVNDANTVVTHNTDTEIVAVTPQLGPGVYILKVVRDASEGGTDESTLQIR